MKLLAVALLLPLFAEEPKDKKPPAPPPVYDREKLVLRIEELAKDAIDKGVPGLTIAVAEGDDVFFSKGFGYADAENAVPAKETTRYPIGSLTRQFTAVAILQLVDQEKIALEDPIEKYLPEFPRGERKITIQQMLSNTSGIPGYDKIMKGTPDAKPGEKEKPAPAKEGEKKPPEKKSGGSLQSAQEDKPAEKPKETLSEKFDTKAAEALFFSKFKDVPFDFPPGTDFSLDSSNYALLSIIVARVSKMPYTQYVKEKVIDLAGLTETQFCPVNEVAVGFARDCKSAWTAPELELPIAEASNLRTQTLCSTVPDLVKWQLALLARAVFSEKGSRRLMAPTALEDGNSTNFGYAIQMTKFHDFKNYAFTGRGGGYSARLSYWSLPKMTIVVVSNCDSAPVEQIEQDIARFVLSVPLPPTEEMALSPEDAARCAGLYQIATTQYRIALQKDGTLWYTPPVDPATRLCHRGELVFAFESNRDVTLKFNVNEEGKVDGFTLYRGGFESKGKRMDGSARAPSR